MPALLIHKHDAPRMKTLKIERKNVASKNIAKLSAAPTISRTIQISNLFVSTLNDANSLFVV